MSAPYRLYRRVRKRLHHLRSPARIDEVVVSQPDPLPGFALLAIVPTWMASDVIAAQVAHLRHQGCDRVYVMDNASPDDTVSAAGAILLPSWRSRKHHDLAMRRRAQRHAVRISQASEHDHVWWLFVDSDEFPKGPGGMTIRELLSGLDRLYRVVGSTFYNHVPTEAPHYVPGFHPGEFQPCCFPVTGIHCGRAHFKHQLLRYDRRNPLRPGEGTHKIVGGARHLAEPPQPLIVQHFQYREAAFTRRRYELLAERVTYDTGALVEPATAMPRRIGQLDAVYAGGGELLGPGGTAAAGLRRFSELVAPAEAAIPRWYPEEALRRARAERKGTASPLSR